MPDLATELFNTLAPEAPLTNNSMINKIIGALFGTVGIAALGLIGSVGLYKFNPQWSGKGLVRAQKMKALINFAWQSLEPAIRVKFPQHKETIYWIDQALDGIGILLNSKEIRSLFGLGSANVQ